MPFPVPNLSPLATINETDIKEFGVGGEGVRTDSVAVDVCDLTVPYKVPGDKLVGFLMWMLGVDYVDSANKLRRTCPAFHPVYNWAWCKSVQITGQGIRGDDTTLVRYPNQNTPMKWAQYSAVATYEMPTYNVYYDGTVDSEYKRFLSKELIPHVELVAVDGGQVVYQANAGDAWNGKPQASLGVVARRQTSGVRLTWHRVPLAFVQADDDTLPDKLLDIQGCVNYTTFLGRPPETLLCIDVRLKKYVSPLVTNTIGQLYFLYDIEFDFAYLKQFDSDIGKVGETRRGHNLLLGPTLKYWYATNATSGKPIFPLKEFADVFTHYLLPLTP